MWREQPPAASSAESGYTQVRREILLEISEAPQRQAPAFRELLRSWPKWVLPSVLLGTMAGYALTLCFDAGASIVHTADGGANALTLKADLRARTDWRVARGGHDSFPQLQLSIDGSDFAPFQLRGFDYSPAAKCCANNDFSPFQVDIYTRDIPRMARIGVPDPGVRDFGLRGTTKGVGGEVSRF